MYDYTLEIMKCTRYIAVALFAVLAIFSCKKTEETVLSESFSGSLKFRIPDFITPGEEYDLTPSGAFTADGSDFGYYWTVNPTATQRDTLRRIGDDASVDGTLHFVVPDTLCQLTISCTVFASGYYNYTYSAKPNVISDESLTGIEISSSTGGIFKDSRDNTDYLYNNVDGVDWICSNLEYANVGVPYESCEAARTLFGQFYTWDEASQACPEGWRLPSVDEWMALCGGDFAGAAGSLMVDAYLNNERMWEYWPDVNITNETLFTALPIGYATLAEKKDLGDGLALYDYFFIGKNSYAAFWTSTPYDEDQAVYVYLNDKTPDVMMASASRSMFAASVRCVR